MTSAFVPSQTDLFPACLDVLNSELRPMHYKELTRKAIAKLGYHEGDVSMFRASEDVRERLPERFRDTIYLSGNNLYAMAFRRWFRCGQLTLGNYVDEPVRIKGSATSGSEGAFNALMRAPYMEDHFGGKIEVRNRVRAKGLVLEQHVKDWFKLHYPDFYLEPRNAGIWQQPCSEDFRLNVNGRVLHIDVAGRNRNGTFGGSKKSTDIHLLCDIDGSDVFWFGTESGERWTENVFEVNSMSPANMLVYLNCAANKIDYDYLRSYVAVH